MEEPAKIMEAAFFAVEEAKKEIDQAGNKKGRHQA